MCVGTKIIRWFRRLFATTKNTRVMQGSLSNSTRHCICAAKLFRTAVYHSVHTDFTSIHNPHIISHSHEAVTLVAWTIWFYIFNNHASIRWQMNACADLWHAALKDSHELKSICISRVMSNVLLKVFSVRCPFLSPHPFNCCHHRNMHAKTLWVAPTTVPDWFASVCSVIEQAGAYRQSTNTNMRIHQTPLRERRNRFCVCGCAVGTWPMRAPPNRKFWCTTNMRTVAMRYTPAFSCVLGAKYRTCRAAAATTTAPIWRGLLI